MREDSCLARKSANNSSGSPSSKFCNLEVLRIPIGTHTLRDTALYINTCINSASHIYLIGAVYAGMGCTALNNLLACVNIPPISSALFKRYEREIGPAIEESAKESCKQAAEQERQLVIDNIQKLCKDLPPEIVNEIYLFMNILSKSSNSSNHAPNNTSVHTLENFDAALGNIVNIIVSYDMGWSKRGNGRSYDSLNGYGTIIGFLSGKILDFATRNRKCKMCDNGREKNDHDCRKNFKGSAKAMEPDVGAFLVNNSTILQEAAVSIRVLIGDEDSSTIANVRRGNSKKVFKLADINHLRKHFVSDLYELQKTHKEMRNKDTIPHLKKCFSYAIGQNKGKISELAAALRSIPDHVFDQHKNCGDWCSRKLNSRKSKKLLLKDVELYNKLMNIFSKYADNAAKFAVVASSQANESVNNMMAHKAPKNRCYSLSESADYRLASAVCSKNDGEIHLLKVNEKLCVSPGKHTASFAKNKDKVKLRRALKAKLPASKCRRNLLANERENLRKKTERTEGIKYKSNCGFEIDRKELNISLDPQILKILEMTQNTFVIQNEFTFVYFDLETSGFERNADILQIAAKFDDYTFDVYVKPTQEINDLHQK
ncbi:PREDICTED: uncharacterized protein LOC105556578 [Vollenhovia emeryi]|uniref:uncharacterized protein LOC105556578 n=1 Tax=Vollenhovia emeryi TaxID=411798 RepID=UPI0005F4E4C7|nr:PREDICTED: uncharacterized protein LOC105556578 [Vollenhovia emeryi]